MFLLLISFIAGVLTVLAPCILPLLPVIVGGSLTDGQINKKKAFTIVGALGVSVIAFTFILKVSTLFINIPEYTWKIISGGIVLILGIVTLFPSLWENRFMARLSTSSNVLLGKGDQKKSFWGDIIVGASLGPVFSTCSPTYFIVLATVLPVSPVKGVIYLLAYTFGLCLSLLVITFIGQKIMSKLGVAADPRGLLKKTLGVLFIIVGVAILTGFDKKIEATLLNSSFDITRVEQKLLQKNDSSSTLNAQVETSTTTSTTQSDTTKTSSTYLTEKQKESQYKRVPELSTIDGYINTDGKSITLAELRGKVVLLDIWTYSCINCQRTIPYIVDWYAKYKDQGFVVVGLHTPEFAFEKVQANVEKAVEKFGIKYPVVLDNDYSTWNALGNQYWPRKYLVDIDGFIVYDHIGEGSYDETEKAIQKALKERAVRMGMPDEVSTSITKPSNAVGVDITKLGSPETYFGSARNTYLTNGQAGTRGVQTLSLPTSFDFNKLYMEGRWNFMPEYAESEGVGSIVFSYNAKNVYFAAEAPSGVEIEIYKDDVLVKKLEVKDAQLYTLISDQNYVKHILKIKVPKAGLRAFTFTFG